MTTEPRNPGTAEAPTSTVAGDVRGEVRFRVLSPWTIAVWAVLIVLVGVGTAVWLLLAYTGGDADANRVQLDAIRTAGTVVVGTGGAAALLLAARRQRSNEIALKQKDRDQADVARAHALQERTALTSEADAAARRITDLYTKAADQLGSDKAPVRLAGLYALERLAQDHVEQRQAIVNVVCAYLRMPYTSPSDAPGDEAEPHQQSEYREQAQEREVRVAAQRILAHHLRPGEDPDDPVETFWADIDLDLTGATLIDLDLDRCTMRGAEFTRATFTGDARFTGATFAGNAGFNHATFAGTAGFNQATFTGFAWFQRATYIGSAEFERATFTDRALFDRATFTGFAWFQQTTFSDKALFDQATFAGNAGFNHATFTGPAWFNQVNFAGSPDFWRATFGGNANFSETTFRGNAAFGEATFTGSAWFNQATFSGDADFHRATLPGTRYAGDGINPSPWADFTQAQFAQGVPPEVAPFVSPLDVDAADERTKQ